jgi:activator of 2-hydroxyglutaryl-CoA dehydratase
MRSLAKIETGNVCEKRDLKGFRERESAAKKESGRRYRGDAHVGVLRMFVIGIDVGSTKKFHLFLKLT